MNERTLQRLAQEPSVQVIKNVLESVVNQADFERFQNSLLSSIAQMIEFEVACIMNPNAEIGLYSHEDVLAEYAGFYYALDAGEPFVYSVPGHATPNIEIPGTWQNANFRTLRNTG